MAPDDQNVREFVHAAERLPEESANGYLGAIGYARVAKLNDVDAGRVAQLISNHRPAFGRSGLRIFGGSAYANGLSVVIGGVGRELRRGSALGAAAAAR